MTDFSMSISVVDKIHACLDLDGPKNFFFFASAGSAEIDSLVRSLKGFRKEDINHLRLSGRKVAIITYTKAARDEIERRLEFDSAFKVSTIHSFVWDLIKPYQADIREWVKGHLQSEVNELSALQRAEKSGSKAASDRQIQITFMLARLEALEYIREFAYDPYGDNTSWHSLNHAEVIDMASEFLHTRKLLQEILVGAFPILLIDESVNAILNRQNQ